ATRWWPSPAPRPVPSARPSASSTCARYWASSAPWWSAARPTSATRRAWWTTRTTSPWTPPATSSASGWAVSSPSPATCGRCAPLPEGGGSGWPRPALSLVTRGRQAFLAGLRPAFGWTLPEADGTMSAPEDMTRPAGRAAHRAPAGGPPPDERYLRGALPIGAPRRLAPPPPSRRRPRRAVGAASGVRGVGGGASGMRTPRARQGGGG